MPSSLNLIWLSTFLCKAEAEPGILRATQHLLRNSLCRDLNLLWYGVWLELCFAYDYSAQVKYMAEEDSNFICIQAMQLSETIKHIHSQTHPPPVRKGSLQLQCLSLYHRRNSSAPKIQVVKKEVAFWEISRCRSE